MQITGETSERMTLVNSLVPKRMGTGLAAFGLILFLFIAFPTFLGQGSWIDSIGDSGGTTLRWKFALSALFPVVVGALLIFLGDPVSYILDRTTRTLTVHIRPLFRPQKTVIIPFQEISGVIAHEDMSDGGGSWVVRFQFTTPHLPYGLATYMPNRARPEEVATRIRHFLSES